MLQEVFYWIFNMSITAALTGVLILLIRQIKRIPRRITVFLWAIPFLRMTVPLGLNSPYSLMSLLSRITTRTVVVYHEDAVKTGSGIHVLIITTDEMNNNGYYNGDYFDPTAYWAQDNVFYSLRVFGDESEKSEIQSILEKILKEI